MPTIGRSFEGDGCGSRPTSRTRRNHPVVAVLAEQRSRFRIWLGFRHERKTRHLGQNGRAPHTDKHSFTDDHALLLVRLNRNVVITRLFDPVQQAGYLHSLDGRGQRTGHLSTGCPSRAQSRIERVARMGPGFARSSRSKGLAARDHQHGSADQQRLFRRRRLPVSAMKRFPPVRRGFGAAVSSAAGRCGRQIGKCLCRRFDYSRWMRPGMCSSPGHY